MMEYSVSRRRTVPVMRSRLQQRENSKGRRRALSCVGSFLCEFPV
jgi:hypothetical protein